MDLNEGYKPSQAQLIYAAACVNRHPNCLDCSHDCLAFARSKSIAIFDKKLGRIVRFIHGHSDDVSSVQFIKTPDQCQNLSNGQAIDEREADVHHWILSTSYDKTSIIWKSETEDRLLYKPVHKLIGHEGPVLAGHSILDNNQSPNSPNILTATSDIDNVTKLWNNDTLVDTLKTEYNVITLKFAKFFNSCYDDKDLTILCLGGSDDNIHIYCISSEHKLIHLIDLTGHADWIKSIDIISLSSSQPIIMLASASQDRFIRVWRISLIESNQSSIRKRIAQVPVALGKGNQRPLFVSTILETVLAGHESRVNDIKWSRLLRKGISDGSDAKVQLLSCSNDKSIIIWESTLALTSLASSQAIPIKCNIDSNEFNITDDIWQEVYRVGEAGECNLGFLGACFSSTSSTIYAYSINGAIHSWESSSNINDKESSIKWNPIQTIGGHFGPLTDIAWQEHGHYFITSSMDKTCRVHGYIEHQKKWNEISRPQVHGYEINCLTLIDSLRLASGADEKTIRLFEATIFFVKTFQELTNKNLLHNKSLSTAGKLAAHAQVPALGLSNRAVSLQEDNHEMSLKNQNKRDYDEKDAFNCLDELNFIPVEEILLQSTLWPEMQKLYGHSYEIYSIASDVKNMYLASASKANKSEFASIIVWDLSSYEKISTLTHHTLTVTRLRYSPDNRYLLSVSRDRTWCLWSNVREDNFKKIASTSKQTTKHERIIWDCSWTPDSSHFVTVSRDRKAIAWNIESVTKQPSEPLINECQSLIVDDSIQAVDILSTIRERKSADGLSVKNFLVAFGLERGDIIIFNLSTLYRQGENTSSVEWSMCFIMENCHQLPIRRIAFRPQNIEVDGDKRIVLASIAEDCTILLNSIK